MEDYKIIGKNKIPTRRNGSKWLILLDPLSYEQAIVFKLPDRKSAQIRTAVLQQCARNGRAEYKLHSRVKVLDSGVELYIWKGKRDE